MLPRNVENAKSEKPLSQRKAAVKLGVSCFHLNRVLNGHRESRSLTRRYQELVSAQGAKT